MTELMAFGLVRMLQGAVLAYGAYILFLYGRSLIPGTFEVMAALFAIHMIIFVFGTIRLFDGAFNPSITDWTYLLSEFCLPAICLKTIQDRRGNGSPLY